MLRCIRCGACMNHCPVYHAVGGHAYGWVYPGPMGAVLTPSLIGVDKAGHLPNASTFCGRCESVCPVQIPLPQADAPLARARVRAASVAGDACAADCGSGRSSRSGRGSTGSATVAGDARCSPSSAAARGRFRWLPLAGGWTRYRDLPAPQGATFQEQWARAEDDAMSARDAIFGTIRRSLGVTGSEAPRRKAVADRLAGASAPASSRRAASCRRRSGSTLFAQMARRSRPARVDARRRCAPTCRRESRHSCAGTTCRRRCGAAPIRCSPRCRGSSEPDARGHDRAVGWRRSSPSVSHAFAGVAETGTLVLDLRARTIRRRSTSCPTTTSSCSTPPDVAGDYETVLAAAARGIRRRRAAAHGQHDHRPVALRRHRADADPRRARAATAARDRGRRGGVKPRQQ